MTVCHALWVLLGVWASLTYSGSDSWGSNPCPPACTPPDTLARLPAKIGYQRKRLDSCKVGWGASLWKQPRPT